MSAFRLPAPRHATSQPGVTLNGIVARAGEVILGKEQEIRLALTCLIARGHLLIEDIPGVGKTTLAHVLARVLGLSFQRVQFTSDLLPADILGISVPAVKSRLHRARLFVRKELLGKSQRRLRAAEGAIP